MLSFELKKPEPDRHPDELEVFLDSEGLESLVAQFRLLQERQTEHVHIMSVSWGAVIWMISPKMLGTRSFTT